MNVFKCQKSYKCRTTVPEASEIFEINAGSREEAASEFHFRYLECLPKVSFFREIDDGKHEKVCFSVVEVDGVEVGIVRTFFIGIYRRCGPYPKLEEIAKKLGWKHNPEKLLESWPGKEN